VIRYFHNGQVVPEDLIFYEGCSQWQKVNTLLPAIKGCVSDHDEEADRLVQNAIAIIDAQVELSPVFHIKQSGDEGPLMEASDLFEKAWKLSPERKEIRYASVASLRLASQFAAAATEMEKYCAEYPDSVLAKVTSAAWRAGSVIAPAPFAFPEVGPSLEKLPEFYSGKLTSFILWPGRKGIAPQAVLFEKDGQGWWTDSKFADLKTEVAVVVDDGNPDVVAIYRRCTGPGLDKADMQESVAVLEQPGDDIALVGWAFLCEQESVGVVIVDAQEKVIFNTEVTLSSRTKNTLKKIGSRLLAAPPGTRSPQEVFNAMRKYQEKSNLDDIEREYFLSPDTDTGETNVSHKTVTACKIWKCPNCQEVLKKGALGTIWQSGDPIVKVAGTGTCLKCGAQFSQADIYGGHYDVEISIASRSTADNPGAVSIIVFLIRSKSPPSDVEMYCRKVFAKKFPKSRMEQYYAVGFMDDLTPEDAMALYESYVRNGQLPYLGRQIDYIKGLGPEAEGIVALFFSEGK
jgi:hypothetical protein